MSNIVGNRLTVVDSIMGAGKTSWAIQEMNEDAGPWLYVTPFKKEIQRIVQACPDRQFTEPLRDRRKGGAWSKSENLIQLIKDGENIATTHALFKLMEADTMAALEQSRYKLILDEVVEVIQPLKIDAATRNTMFDEGMLVYDEDTTNGDKVRQILPGPAKAFNRWALPAGGPQLTVQRVRSWAETNRLIQVNGSLLMWLLPVDCFKSFERIYNLTYLFNGSSCKAYFDLQGLDYEYKAVGGGCGEAYRLVPHEPSAESSVRKHIWELITLYDGPLNDPGKKHNAFSKGWWGRGTKPNERMMKAKMFAFFKRNTPANTGAAENMWSCFKSNRDQMVGSGHAKKAWVPSNSRATNDWKHKANLAYLVNVYMDFSVQQYFEALNYHLDAEQYALSQLVQWIWRSRIREGKPINLYLPSSRMRSILREWANGGDVPEPTIVPMEAAA